MVMHNQPTELYAKYDTTCPRPSCDAPIKQGDKIRVYNDKWYHGNCSLKLESDKDKRLQKKARNLNRKSKITFFKEAEHIAGFESTTHSQFGGDTGVDADYKYEHDQINEKDIKNELYGPEHETGVGSVKPKITKPSPVPGGTTDKKFGPSPVEALCNDLAIERRKHNVVITALTWYARRSNYECNVEHDKPAVIHDEGNKAREAIKGLMDIG